MLTYVRLWDCRRMTSMESTLSPSLRRTIQVYISVSLFTNREPKSTFEDLNIKFIIKSCNDFMVLTFKQMVLNFWKSWRKWLKTTLTTPTSALSGSTLMISHWCGCFSLLSTFCVCVIYTFRHCSHCFHSVLPLCLPFSWFHTGRKLLASTSPPLRSVWWM